MAENMSDKTFAFLSRMADEWGVSPLERVTTPVFIGGIPRSGTTACNILLQRSLLEKFAPLTEMPESFFWDSYRDPGNASFIQSKIAYLGGTTSYVDFYNHVVNRRHAWSRTFDFRDLCALYFALGKKQWQLKEALEKTPSNLLFAEQIFEVFPSAVLVVMTRHPYAVYCSMLKRSTIEPDAEWLKMDVEQFSWFYKFNVDEAYKALQKYDGRVLLCKFEDAVINTDQILSFIDQGINQHKIRPVSDNPFRPGDSVDEYFDILRPQLGLLRQILGETMEYLEYPADMDRGELV
jgi:hypothetical protein